MKNYPLLFAALAIGMGIGMPAQADPPSWAPAHGRRAQEVREVREYRYVYYPEQQVYYAPEQKMWFWMNGGNWQFGVNLPMQYASYTSGGVSVTLHSARPYVEHVYVEEHYGRPWREKHGHRDRHDGRRDEDHRGYEERHGHDDHHGHGHRD